MSAVTIQARNTVNKTPDLLPQLKEAGVVDAGGKGLFYVFLGMKQFFSREITQFEERHTITHKAEIYSEHQYGFDLQFLIEGEQLHLDEIRNKIIGMGDSVLVVGDEKVIRVHVHTREPQAVLDYCATRGTLKDIVEEDMDKQAARFLNASLAEVTHHQE
jgi:dihydroxyacetone kinase-like predicted kinase